MRVLVCGGRDFTDREWLYSVLDSLPSKPMYVIHGGAAGADKMAGEWAKSRFIPALVFEADWKQHGRAAGPIRNQFMLDEGHPDLVIAFPGGRGTADMVRKAEAAGVPVMRCQRASLSDVV